MNAGAKLATFGVGALALFGAAFGVGRAVGPVGEAHPAPHGPDHPSTTTQGTETGADQPVVTTHPAGHEDGQP